MNEFTLRKLSPTERWCDLCRCYVERYDAVKWTADGSFTHYLCPGCDAELWEPESNEELYTAEEKAEAREARAKRNSNEFPLACEHKNMLPSEPHGFLYCPDCGLRN